MTIRSEAFKGIQITNTDEYDLMHPVAKPRLKIFKSWLYAAQVCSSNV